MYTLIVSMAFVPMFWGDSNTSTTQIEGFPSFESCKQEAIKFTDKQTPNGKFYYDTFCIKVEDI